MRTPRGPERRAFRPIELVWDFGLALAFGLAAIGLFAAMWSGPSDDSASPRGVFVGTFSSAEANADMISIHVTANASLRNIIHGSETEIAIPKGGTVAQLSNRLTDRYPELEPAAMVAINGGMLPLSLGLNDGQTVELMAPHSASLTFLGRPLPAP